MKNLKINTEKALLLSKAIPAINAITFVATCADAKAREEKNVPKQILVISLTAIATLIVTVGLSLDFKKRDIEKEFAEEFPEFEEDYAE